MRYILVIATILATSLLSRGAPVSNRRESEINSTELLPGAPVNTATGHHDDLVHPSLTTRSEYRYPQLVRRVETQLDTLRKQIEEHKNRKKKHKEDWDHYDDAVCSTPEEERVKDLQIARYSYLMQAENNYIAALEAKVEMRKNHLSTKIGLARVTKCTESAKDWEIRASALEEEIQRLKGKARGA
ncbi:hypothetical protein FRC15_005689 [Serendipita sp. 397]|nr:hypothetical protein FRC15_005689 [Serendipita sp. 397]